MPGPLTLSLSTLFYVGAVSGLVGAFLLLGPAANRDEDRGQMRLFGWSMAAGAVWMALLWYEASSGNRAPPLSGLLAMCQGALFLQGTLNLFGGRQPEWLIPITLGLGIPLYLAAFSLLPAPASFLLVASLYAAFHALAAFHAWRARDPIGKGCRRAFTGLYGLLSVLTLSRVASLLWNGHEPQAALGVYASSPIHNLTAMVMALSPLLTALIVLGMLNARMADRLRERAQTDELTGVHTRRHLLDEAPALLVRLRGEGRHSAVLMLDLDHFKQINDVHGHRVGDLALKRAAHVMRHAMRADSLLARYGGEEFCAIIPVDNEADAVQAAERIRDTLARLELTVGPHRVRLTVSIGLALQRGDLRFDELLTIADEGVYRAKASGRNCVVAPGMALPAISPPGRPRLGPRARPA